MSNIKTWNEMYLTLSYLNGRPINSFQPMELANIEISELRAALEKAERELADNRECIRGQRTNFDLELSVIEGERDAALAEIAASSFPERDAGLKNTEQGIFRKFAVRRVDGSDAPGGKHDGCEYFVLDMTHDKHAPAALLVYADSCRTTHPRLSEDLISRFGAAPVSDGWKPIETAPKDGTRIILAWPGDRVWTGHFKLRTTDTHLTPWRRDKFGLGDTTWGYEPTHWMPLPASPKEP